MRDEPEEPIDSAGNGDAGTLADGGWRGRLNQTYAGRPLAVYLVLLAGAATLAVLLGIVWITATGGGSEDRPICTAISAPEARDAILAGGVDRINVLVDKNDPKQTLTGIVLDMKDATCRQSPQGADVRSDLFMIVGAAEFFNNFADRDVSVHYQEQSVEPILLVTSTPTPEPTLPPTETIEPTVPATMPPTSFPSPTLGSPTAAAPPLTATPPAAPDAPTSSMSPTAAATSTAGG